MPVEGLQQAPDTSTGMGTSRPYDVRRQRCTPASAAVSPYSMNTRRVNAREQERFASLVRNTTGTIGRRKWSQPARVVAVLRNGARVVRVRALCARQENINHEGKESLLRRLTSYVTICYHRAMNAIVPKKCPEPAFARAKSASEECATSAVPAL